jgi:hypothetical protein
MPFSLLVPYRSDFRQDLLIGDAAFLGDRPGLFHSDGKALPGPFHLPAELQEKIGLTPFPAYSGRGLGF